MWHILSQKYLFIIILLGLVVSACGYRFGDTKSIWANSGKTLYVELFENESQVSEGGAIFTAVSRDVFASQGGFTLADKGIADFVLVGTIQKISQSVSALRFKDSGSHVAGYELSAKIKLLMYDKSGLLLWSTSVQDQTDFLGADVVTHMRDNRQKAVVKLAKIIMERAYIRLAEDF